LGDSEDSHADSPIVAMRALDHPVNRSYRRVCPMQKVLVREQTYVVEALDKPARNEDSFHSESS